MFFGLVLLGVSADIFTSLDLSLDPVEIRWPNAWVNNLVQLSSNHAGKSSASLAVTCSVATAIPKDSYVEINLPSFSSSPFNTAASTDFAAGADMVFTFGSITIPSTAGVYGPITMTIRQAVGGQVIAASTNLGSLAILASEPTALTTLGVAYGSGASTTVSESTILTFTIPLSVTLQTYDYFNITVDSLFGIGSLTGPTWNSLDPVNLQFNTTGMAYDATSRQIMIYGLKQEVSNSPSIVFSIGGFTNPAYTGASYTWKADFYRFGTKTTLQKFTGAGTLTVTAGNVILGAWTPSNGYITNEFITNGAVLYMQLTFSLQHIVPASGLIKVTFTGVDVSKGYLNTNQYQLTANLDTTKAYIDYYPNSFITGCTYSSSIFTCTVGTNPLPSGTTVTLHNLVIFSSTTAAVSVTTTTSASQTIDSKSNLATIANAAAAKAVLLVEPNLGFYASTTTAGASELLTAGLTTPSSFYVDVTLSDTFTVTPTTAITVSLPLTVSTTSVDNTIAWSSAGYGLGKTTATYTDFTGGTTTLGVTSAANTLTVAVGLASSSGRISMLLLPGTSGSVGTIKFPKFATGQAFRTEILVKYTNSVSVLKYFSKPFCFATGTATIVFDQTCHDSVAPGLPARLTVTPVYDWSASSDYVAYIDFTVTSSVPTGLGNNLGSGLASGSSYPFSGGATGSTLTLYSLSGDAAGVSRLLYNVGASNNLAVASPVALVIPIPALVINQNHAATAVIYAKRTSDGSKFYMSAITSADSILADTNALPSLLVGTVSSPTATQFTQTALSSLTGSLSSVAAASSAKLVAVGFDQGWSIPTGATVSIAGSTAVALTVLQSTDPKFPYISGYAIVTFTDAASISGVVSSATTSWLSGTSNMYLTIGSSGNFDSSPAACRIKGKFSFTLNAKKLTVTNYSPLTSEGLGINVQKTDLSITITVPGIINSLSSVVTAINSQFQVTGCKWSLTLGSYSESGTISGSSFTTTEASFTSSIAASATLTIKVFGAGVPSISTAIKYPGFDSVYIKNTGGSVTVYSFLESTDGSDNTKTSFSAGTTTTGTTTISALKVFPNTIGTKPVYFWIQFKPSLAIPAGSTIKLTGETFATDTSAYVNTWCNYGFTSVTVSGTSLTITVLKSIPANSLVEIRKDLAFNVPSTSPAAWKVTAAYGSTNIIVDTAETNKLVFASTPATTISGLTITPTFTNQGLHSWYKFSFQPGVATDNTTLFIFDVPGDYSAHPGKTYSYSLIPSVYYLSANSSFVNSLACTTSHWMVICSGLKAATATTVIDISLMIENPAGTTESWGLIITSSSYAILAQPSYVSITLTAPPANNIDIYNITHDLAPALTATHKINVKLSETYVAGASLIVMFPAPFNTMLYNPGSVSCSASYNSTSGIVNMVPTGSNCQIGNNMAVFNLTAAATPNGVSTLELNDLTVPLKGLVRSDGLDTNKNQFNNFNFWTGKFSIYSISTLTSNVIASASYDNLNAAYTGYFAGPWQTLVINKGSTITLSPGTLSDYISITVTNGILNAKLLTVTPSDPTSSVLVFDMASYNLTIERPFNSFRIGAPSGTANGFYYITWSITEDSIKTGIKNYAPPAKTKVQVFYNLDNRVSVNVGSIGPVSMNYGSLPIKVSLNGASPLKGLEFTPKISGNSTSLTFNPPVLKFSAGVLVEYFSIQLSGNATSGQAFTINFSLSGADAAAYILSSTSSVVTVGNQYSSAAVIKGYFTSTSKTEASITLDSDSSGIATWLMTSSWLFDLNSEVFSDYESVLNATWPLVGEPNGDQIPTELQIYIWQTIIDGIDQSDWREYSATLLIISQFSFFSGQVYVSNTKGQVIQSFSNLIANTEYTTLIFVDNLSGNITMSDILRANTSALENPARINLVFTDVVSSSNSDKLNSAVCQALLLQTSRCVSFENYTSSRMLLTSAPVYLLPSVSSNTNSLTVANTLSAAAVLSNAQSLGMTLTSAPTYSTVGVTPNDFGTPSLDSATYNYTDGYLDFSFVATVDGFACCVYQINDTTLLSAVEIYLATNENGENISDNQECVDTVKGETVRIPLNVSEIGLVGNYTGTCTSCNYYPILPECVDGDSVFTVTVEWTNTTSSAYLIGMALGLALMQLA